MKIIDYSKLYFIIRIQGDGSRLRRFQSKTPGSRRNKGVALITYGFTLKEVILLFNILIIKFDIQPVIYSYEQVWDPKIYRGSKPELAKIQHQIQINEKDLNKIRPKLLPYFSDHFYIKLTLGCKALDLGSMGQLYAENSMSKKGD